MLSSLFELAAPRLYVFCAITVPFGFPSRFRTFTMLHAFAVGWVIFLVSFEFQYQDLSADGTLLD